MSIVSIVNIFWDKSNHHYRWRIFFYFIYNPYYMLGDTACIIYLLHRRCTVTMEHSSYLLHIPDVLTHCTWIIPLALLQVLLLKLNPDWQTDTLLSGLFNNAYYTDKQWLQTCIADNVCYNYKTHSSCHQVYSMYDKLFHKNDYSIAMTIQDGLAYSRMCAVTVLYLSGGDPIETEVLSDVVFACCTRNVDFVAQQKDRTRRELLIP